MTMHLVLLFPTLIQQSELKQSPDISAITGEGDKDGDISGIVLEVFTVGVKVDGPVVAADGESVGGEVFTGGDALGEGVTADGEGVGPVHRLVD